jgi:hypothetical protein
MYIYIPVDVKEFIISGLYVDMIIGSFRIISLLVTVILLLLCRNTALDINTAEKSQDQKTVTVTRYDKIESNHSTSENSI